MFAIESGTYPAWQPKLKVVFQLQATGHAERNARMQQFALGSQDVSLTRLRSTTAAYGHGSGGLRIVRQASRTNGSLRQILVAEITPPNLNRRIDSVPLHLAPRFHQPRRQSETKDCIHLLTEYPGSGLQFHCFHVWSSLRREARWEQEQSRCDEVTLSVTSAGLPRLS